MKINIYILKDPTTLQIRYVGKTKNNLTKRLYEHCTQRNLTSNTHKNNWIKNLLKKGLKPIIELLETSEESNWQEREKYWIQFFINNGEKLTNSTVGGEGAITGRLTREQIQKGINTRRKNNTLTRTKECREKIALSKIGTTHSKEQTEKVAESTRKPILQCDLEGNIIKEWKGIRFCAETLGFDRHGIIACLKGRQKKYKNFKWIYK